MSRWGKVELILYDGGGAAEKAVANIKRPTQSGNWTLVD